MKETTQITFNRRRFLCSAAMSVAAAELGLIDSANAQTSDAQPSNLPSLDLATNGSFGALKQIDAGLLNVGYAEAGPADGRPVISTRLALRHLQLC